MRIHPGRRGTDLPAQADDHKCSALAGAFPLSRKLEIGNHALISASLGIPSALVTIGFPAVPQLCSFLRKKERQRWTTPLVIGVIGKIGDREAIPALERFLENADSLEDCQSAADALLLMEWKPRTANQMVRYAFAKEDYTTIKKLGWPDSGRRDSLATEPLLSVLQIPQSVDSSLGIAAALAELGDLRAVGPLVDFYVSERMHDNCSACAKFQDVLSHFGEPAFALLLKTFQDEKCPCRPRIAAALGKFHNPRAVPALSEALAQEQSDGLAEEAAEALGKIYHQSAVDCLLGEIRRTDRDKMHYKVAEALIGLREPRSVRALKQAALDWIGTNSVFTRRQAFVLVQGIKKILTARACDILTDDLQDLLQLPDELVCHVSEFRESPTHDGWESWEEKQSCVAVKELARDELKRRESRMN